MKKFNTFKVWFGKKLIDWGFGILLGIDERGWNPKRECYTGSVKQFKYAVGSWLVRHGMYMETRALNNLEWPGFTEFKYYDKNFYLGNNPYTQKFKKKKKRNNDDGPDFGNLFKDWK